MIFLHSKLKELFLYIVPKFQRKICSFAKVMALKVKFSKVADVCWHARLSVTLFCGKGGDRARPGTLFRG